MLRFMLIRILQALPVIFVVITATFFLVRSAPRRAAPSAPRTPSRKTLLPALSNLWNTAFSRTI